MGWHNRSCKSVMGDSGQTMCFGFAQCGIRRDNCDGCICPRLQGAQFCLIQTLTMRASLWRAKPAIFRIDFKRSGPKIFPAGVSGIAHWICGNQSTHRDPVGESKGGRSKPPFHHPALCPESGTYTADVKTIIQCVIGTAAQLWIRVL